VKWTLDQRQRRGDMIAARLLLDEAPTGLVFAKPAELDDLVATLNGDRGVLAGEERDAIRAEIGAKETESTLDAAVRLRAELKAAHEANIVLRGKAVDAATARVVDLAAAIRAVPLELLSKGLSDAFTAEIERTRDAKGFEGAVAALASRHFAAVEGVREAIIAGLVPSLEEVAAAAEQLSPPIDASFDEEEAAEPVDVSDEKHPTPCACDVGHPEMCPHALDEAPRWVREALKEQEQSLQGFRTQDMKAVAMAARFAIARLESTAKYIDALFGSAHALKADACQPMIEAITVLGVLVKAGDDFSALEEGRRKVREEEALRARDAAVEKARANAVACDGCGGQADEGDHATCSARARELEVTAPPHDRIVEEVASVLAVGRSWKNVSDWAKARFREDARRAIPVVLRALLTPQAVTRGSQALDDAIGPGGPFASPDWTIAVLRAGIATLQKGAAS
jgi:hypothetical protein